MKKILLICLFLLAVFVPAKAGNVVTMFKSQGADVTAPTVSTATIGTNGTTLTLGMSETVTRSGGTFDVDCATAGANLTATYSSGSGSSSLVYTIGTTVNSGDTCNLDYDGAGNGIEDGADNDLAAITDKAITNNSTQGSGTYYYNGGTTDVYTSTDNSNVYVGYRYGDRWTPGVTKSITKIGCKIGGTHGPVTLALWTVSGGTLTFQRCVTISSPTSGWNDGNITAYSLSSGTEIAITVILSEDVYDNTYYFFGSSGGYWSTGNTYANECSSTTISTSDDTHYGVRFYGQ